MKDYDRTRIEEYIWEDFEDLSSAWSTMDWDGILICWMRMLYWASILRTEIDNDGVPYSKRKDREKRQALTGPDKIRQEIFICMQEIILAKQDHDLLKFAYWYAKLTDIIRYFGITKPRIFEEA